MQVKNDRIGELLQQQEDSKAGHTILAAVAWKALVCRVVAIGLDMAERMRCVCWSRVLASMMY